MLASVEAVCPSSLVALSRLTRAGELTARDGFLVPLEVNLNAGPAPFLTNVVVVREWLRVPRMRLSPVVAKVA